MVNSKLGSFRWPSSSSWGCELKWQWNLLCIVRIWRHPLREDVSWNIMQTLRTAGCLRHPLREDVSWNGISSTDTRSTSSHPLREDVSWNAENYGHYAEDPGHPLREDVSWNDLNGFKYMVGATSSSSWGCELKYPRLHILCLRNVILFVRMWVEIFYTNWSVFWRIVILFVRMWVEISENGIGNVIVAVILFVRMWVEI